MGWRIIVWTYNKLIKFLFLFYRLMSKNNTLNQLNDFNLKKMFELSRFFFLYSWKFYSNKLKDENKWFYEEGILDLLSN